MRPSQYTAYVAPSMILAFLFGPIGVLQGIYAKYFGVTLTTIALVLLISRLFDAVTDPLIGYFSDRYYTNSGSRKPFVVVGGLLFIISSYFLYVPIEPDHITGATVVSAIYFLCWFLIFYLAWTLFEIPHLAWGAELAPDAQAANKIYSLRSMSSSLGVILFYLVPLMPIFPNNEFTPKTLQWSVIVAGLLMLPSLYYCVKFVPLNRKVSSTNKNKRSSIWALRREIISNKPFLLFIAAFCLFGIGGSGMWFTLMFIYIDSYLKLGNYFAPLTILGLIVGFLSIGIWYWIANVIGKKLAWGLGVFIYLLGVFGVSFLKPDQYSIAILSVMIVFVYLGSIPINAISPSLLVDIIDYSTWKFGANNTATYFSLYMFALKTSLAIGGSIGLGVSAAFGFDPTAVSHSDKAIFGLNLFACWLPVLLMLLSIVMMSLVRMNTHYHGIVLRRLDRRLALHIKPNRITF